MKYSQNWTHLWNPALWFTSCLKTIQFNHKIHYYQKYVMQFNSFLKLNVNIAGLFSCIIFLLCCFCRWQHCQTLHQIDTYDYTVFQTLTVYVTSSPYQAKYSWQPLLMDSEQFYKQLGYKDSTAATSGPIEQKTIPPPRLPQVRNSKLIQKWCSHLEVVLLFWKNGCEMTDKLETLQEKLIEKEKVTEDWNWRPKKYTNVEIIEKLPLLYPDTCKSLWHDTDKIDKPHNPLIYDI